MPNSTEHDALLNEQLEYYRARADEYDEWFLRSGRYDRGPELNQKWFDEVEQVRRRLWDFGPAGDILELACGTGLWTGLLLPQAAHLTAVDAAAEVLTLNQARVHSPKVTYVQANVFDWHPTRRYDVVFFSFWLTHVPSERFNAFWELVNAALVPGGRVFFADSRYEPASTAVDHRLEGEQATAVTRRLNDGREFRIVKVFYRADELARRLSSLGWDMNIDETANYFIFGHGQRIATSSQ